MTESDHNFDYKQSAENRRNTRRDFERGIISNEPDRFQLNDIMLGALVVIAAILSFTDFSFSAGDWKNLTALTLFLYIITMFIYRNRYEKGMARGKRDSEYQLSLKTYRENRNEISLKNLASHVPEFCTYYKKQELREYRESLLCDIEMDYDTYKEKYLMMSKKDVLNLPISIEAKRVILKCNCAKAVKLYPGMILNESGEFDRDKLIGKSGRQRERQDKKKQAITRAVYVLFGAAVAFDMIFNFSLATIAQWVVRMLPIIIAMVSGDDGGYCNITVTETNFKRDQSNVIGIFMEYAKRNNLVEEDKKPPEDPPEETSEEVEPPTNN
jgi:hypothetical protein